ncbi:MAG: altered inheritance of mitochondria protein 21 [bacterium]|nr:altered inheritance of mitochondria protein 21 [bacterium]
MYGQNNKIDFTNLANRKSKDIYYILIVIITIIISSIVILFLLGVFDKKENNNDKIPPSNDKVSTPSDNEENNSVSTPSDTEENNNENVSSEELSSLEKAKASTFLANVQILYKSAQINFVSQSQQGNVISEVSPRMNSVETTLNYCVKLDTSGKIIKLQAEDSMFNIELNQINSLSEIKIEDVKKGKLSSNDCN